MGECNAKQRWCVSDVVSFLFPVSAMPCEICSCDSSLMLKSGSTKGGNGERWGDLGLATGDVQNASYEVRLVVEAAKRVRWSDVNCGICNNVSRFVCSCGDDVKMICNFIR